jgi:hypothetical protein
MLFFRGKEETVLIHSENFKLPEEIDRSNSCDAKAVSVWGLPVAVREQKRC